MARRLRRWTAGKDADVKQFDGRAGVVSAAVALAATMAMAATPGAAAQQMTSAEAIAFLDGSGDGKVDADEYARFQSSRCPGFDANGDQKLSMEEFTASLPPAEQRATSQTFPSFDSNQDGGLDNGEFMAYHAYILRTYIDTDKDGYMSIAEFDVVRRPAEPAARQTASAPATPASGLAVLDYNKDGKTDLNEYLNFQLPNLKKFDANGNGRLSRDEFKASLPPGAQKNAARSFDAFDRDKDNGLEQQEFLSYHAFVFNNVLDRNKDGFVDGKEWARLAAEGRN
jgi:Ca2+-binding EF-hand superfamily protein